MFRPFLIAISLFALPGLSMALPGDPDLTFGVNGKVLTDFGGYHQVTCLALQKNGRILAAGGSTDGGPWLLVRYLPDGKLDPSFGKGGVVATTFGDAFTWCTSIAVDTDGRIVLAGKTGESLRRCDFAVARYLPDGTMDESFGDKGGIVTLFPKGFGAESVLIQKDGRILVSGSAGTSSQAITVMRHLPSGKIDRTFGADGLVRIALRKTTRGSIGSGTGKAALQSDGKILVAGADDMSVLLARLNPDGTADTSFSKSGVLKVATSAAVNALSVSRDGKILLADGTALSIFNRKGIRLHYFYYRPYQTPYFSSPKAVAFGSAGDFMIAASSYPGRDEQSFSLARFTRDAVYDPAFGENGQVTTGFGNSYEVPSAMLIQPDGKILTAGVSARFQGGASFALARHEGGRLRPDLLIGDPKEGNNVYDAGSLRREVSLNSKGETKSVNIILQNDGTVKEIFDIKGFRTGKAAFGFRYFEGENDISSEVLKGNYVTPPISPGKALRFRVEITSREIHGVKTAYCSFYAFSRMREVAMDGVVIDARSSAR